MLMGHEDAGEVVEVGSHVEYIKKGDICSVPFNVACGTCTNCKERHTDVCLRANSWIGNETRDSLRWPFQYARGAIGTIPLQS